MAPVHTADAAGGKDADAGPVGQVHRRGDGRAAAGSLGQHGGQVSQADLAGCPVGGQPRQFVPGQPHPRLTFEHGDGGR